MVKIHSYSLSIDWTGNRGSGTSDNRAYGRDHEIAGVQKLAPILGSSDSAFRGCAERWNPEELFVAALSACHMLWFLHLCAARGITVVAYSDEPIGRMNEHDDGAGEFTDVTLRPRVQLKAPDRVAELPAIHEAAHAMCFIARSVNCEVKVLAHRSIGPD